MKIYNNEHETYIAVVDILKEYYNINESDFKKLIYVDVGAGEPEYYSNSFYFRNKIETIIAIEPIKRFCEMFEKIGYPVLNYAAISEDKGEILFREYYSNFNGMSYSSVNIDVEYNKEYKEYLVPAMTLNTILKTHYPEIEKIDILDIDTEGTELLVLDGIDLVKYNPKIIIVENYFNPESNGYYQYYEKIGYKMVAKCAHNEILIKM